MSLPKLALFAALGVVNLMFVAAWVRRGRAHGRGEPPSMGDVLIGFVTDFGDALGIGSFAPTTALYKLRGTPADELIPGTLNIGHNAAAFLETLIFTTVVAVEPVLLATMVASASVGAWLGAGIVGRLPRRAVQLAMGAALLTAAIFLAMSNLGAFPAGGTAMALAGWRFGVAVGINFVLGALMTIGIGNYAPSVVLLSLLGMHPLGAFPIMMGTCGIVQPVAGLRFIRSGRFAWGPALGLTLGGIAGVLLAVYVVKQLPLKVLRWGVIVVVTYAAASMLRSAYCAGRRGRATLWS
ncbi:MAG TPA: sulfite exporter TauE/SafE family protein [Steroidobacteraceae bacterium]